MKLNLFDQDFNAAPKEFAPAKGSERIQINNVLGAISIAVLAILAGSKNPHPGYIIIFSELAIAIPCLVTSSLLYSKMCYRPAIEYKYWNGSAWATHTVGYFLIIDALFLLLCTNFFPIPAIILLLTTFLLVVVYSIVDVITAETKEVKLERLKEKMVKGLCYILLILVGLLTPLLFKISY